MISSGCCTWVCDSMVRVCGRNLMYCLSKRGATAVESQRIAVVRPNPPKESQAMHDPL